jgi:hypothetical protein
MEKFVYFQDSQNTRRAYLAYLERCGGEWASVLQTLPSQIVDAEGYHLIPLYRLVGPTGVIIILIMFILGMVRMLLDILMRVIIIARAHGCVFWMFGALWDTAFQVEVSLIRWAVEKGRVSSGRIKNQMEACAAQERLVTWERQITWKSWRTGQRRGASRCTV